MAALQKLAEFNKLNGDLAQRTPGSSIGSTPALCTRPDAGRVKAADRRPLKASHPTHMALISRVFITNMLWALLGLQVRGK